MGTIAVSLALLVAAALYMLMQHTDQLHQQQQMKEEYDRQIQQLKNEEQQNSRNVWMTAKKIPAGVALKADDLKAVPMPVSLVPGRRHHRPGKHHRQKRQDRACAGTVVWLELKEMDILQTSSAIIDAYLQGARLWSTIRPIRRC